jgi:hypothetical protein
MKILSACDYAQDFKRVSIRFAHGRRLTQCKFHMTLEIQFSSMYHRAVEKSGQRSAFSNQPTSEAESCKLNADRPGSCKDPAAVALGKRRIAKMTPEEAAEFHRAGAKAVQASNRKRSPLERRMSGMLAWRTRRMRPAWMAKQQRSAISSQRSAGSPPTPPPSERELKADKLSADCSALARLLDSASDEALERLRSAMIAPWNSVTNSVR